jgi:hypothetical protein
MPWKTDFGWENTDVTDHVTRRNPEKNNLITRLLELSAFNEA